MNDIKIISKYRNELYGISAIFIVLVHILEFGNWKSGVWVPLRSIITTVFSLGVPIFSFLSGMSIYYSLQKHDTVWSFYKKRIQRVIIPYLIIGGIYYFITYIIVDFNPLEFLLQLSTIAFWTEHGSAWYIAMLVILYLVSPAIVKWFDRGGYLAKCAAIYAALFVVASLLSVFNNDAYNNYYLLIRTASLYFLGLAFGKGLKGNRNVKMLVILFVPIIIYGLMAVVYKTTGIYFESALDFGYALLGISAIVLLAILLDKTCKNNKILSKFGMISLESYLFNTYLMKVAHLFTDSMSIDIAIKMFYLIFVGVLGIVLSYLFNKLYSRLIKRY